MDVSNTINSQSQANSPLAAKMLCNREPNFYGLHILYSFFAFQIAENNAC